MMKKNLLLLLIPLMLAACTGRQAEDNRPVITVTILPMQYFAEQLAGDRFRINVMVPPGASHHNYDPTPRQLKDLENSKVLFINGHLGFEIAWVPKMKSNYPNLPIVDLSSGIDLITIEGGEGGHTSDEHGEAEGSGHDHEGVDPHYWLSVTEAHRLAANMAEGLIRVDPDMRDEIESNRARLDKRLDSLALAMQTKFRDMTRRSFMIFHPALGYFARDFHFFQYSMELAGKEPTASHFRELVDLARKEQINTIFIQKEYDQENASTFSRETGARIVTIDPMSPDWFREMEQLGNRVAEIEKRQP